ncbi:hypothetical protein [Sphingomicrobium lutaoense]|uniref:DUF2860 domain-containing protein n=1 Tax=Sphingomicrobium lutaoense TaxID=515949 RepID=A0A839Z323_9SPHN|nr:hypothetical protein [Sphingomicrobium lutaoense]MBB3762984.1 hypothetical protein [Sphingomicrobium lutaoense]
MSKLHCIFAGFLALPAAANAEAQKDSQPSFAVGSDVVYSTDAEGTDVLRFGLNLSPSYRGPDDHWGFRIERLQFQSERIAPEADERLYVRYAKTMKDWQVRTQVGTNGDSIIGSASLHNDAPVRWEFFLERDLLETSNGIEDSLYTTFGGAAVDVPLSEQTQVTLLAGLQEFDGDNLRTHIRSNLVYVASPELGLSVQFRARYFRNSVPREGDYFSPKEYLELLPVLQFRRFVDGWQFLGAAGWGTQKDSHSNWRPSHHLNLRAASPRVANNWSIHGQVTYSNHPIADTQNYDYLRVAAGLTRVF